MLPPDFTVLAFAVDTVVEGVFCLADRVLCSILSKAGTPSWELVGVVLGSLG